MQENSLKSYPFWVYVLLFLVSQLAAMATPFVLPMMEWGRDWTESAVLVTTLLVANLLAIGLFFCFRPGRLTLASTFSGVCGRQAMRTILVVLLAVPAILLVNLAQELLLPEIPDLVGEETFKAIMYHPLGLLTVAFIGPVSEELLFRGGVQTALEKKNSSILTPQSSFITPHSSFISPQSSFLNRHSPILISALIFSIIHLNPAQLPAAFLLGLLLGYAYWWTGSLIAPVCIHILNNGSACLMAFWSPEEDSFVSLLGGNEAAWMTMGLCVVFFLFVVWLMRRFR